MTEQDIEQTEQDPGPWWEAAPPAANMANLVHGLEWISEIIREIDGGDPRTKTGWKSEEMLMLWLDVLDILDKAKGRT